MKTFFSIIFFFCLISVSIFPQPWELMNADLPSDAIAAPFSPVNDNVIWAAWSSSWFGTGSANGYLKSTNGGATWVCDTIPQLNNGIIWWIEALDANTAFLAVEAWLAWGMQGIYKTTDGGATWERDTSVYVSSDYGPAYIHFFDSNNGVVVGERNPDYFEIFTTTNGGTDWNPVSTSNIPQANTGEWLNPIEVAEYGDNVWLPTTGYPSSIPRFLKTTDNGYSWTALDIGFTADYYVFPAFQNENIGILSAWSLDVTAYELKKTVDGGVTWNSLSAPYGGCLPLNVSYVPGTSSGYVITGCLNVNGYSTGSAYTLDGGNTWTNLDDGNYCYTIFNSDLSGWATNWGTNSFYKYVGPPLPVPVELTSFCAAADGNDVILSWKTSTETNNKGFDIQRSEVGDQKSEWKKVGFVEGKGTTTEEQNYSFSDKKVPEGSYTYRLKQIDLNGAVNYSEEVNIEVKAVYTYYLDQNYPNPFNPTTTIKFGLKKKSNVRIDIFSSIGENVKTILNEERDPGNYTINFNAGDMPSGVYLYRITSETFSSVKKMMLVK
jgi:photosystem II stability/assembly factor-like uncharacterized protein